MARVLLVDDDYDIRELGRALLVHAGHEVLVADNAITALQLIRRKDVDILITDVGMPNLSGLDLLKMIRLERIENLTVVMLTGRREKRDIEEALAAGVHDYIVKPIDPNLFLKKISEILVRRPVRERHAHEFARLQVNFTAQASLAINIRSISELGIIVRTPHALKPGTLMTLESEVFDEIGIPHPAVRVFVSQEREGQFETRLSFVDLHDDALAKIRSWVSDRGRRSVKATG